MRWKPDKSRRTRNLSIRVTDEEERLYYEAADADERDFSDWVRRTLTKRAHHFGSLVARGGAEVLIGKTAGLPAENRHTDVCEFYNAHCKIAECVVTRPLAPLCLRSDPSAGVGAFLGVTAGDPGTACLLRAPRGRARSGSLALVSRGRARRRMCHDPGRSRRSVGSSPVP